jgi:hypothetical protein
MERDDMPTILDGSALAPERMQAIAAWTNLGGHAVTCVEGTLSV